MAGAHETPTAFKEFSSWCPTCHRFPLRQAAKTSSRFRAHSSNERSWRGKMGRSSLSSDAVTGPVKTEAAPPKAPNHSENWPWSANFCSWLIPCHPILGKMVLWRNEDRCWGKLGTLGAYMGPLNFRPHIIQYNPRVQQKNLSVVRTSWKNGQTGKGKRVGAGVEQKDVIRSGSESLIHSSDPFFYGNFCAR